MRTIEEKQNKAGTRFALMELDNGNGLVYILKHNYVRSAIRARWFCCMTSQKQSHGAFQKMAREGMAMADARAMFNKKIQGKQKG